MELIDGNQIAQEVLDELQSRISAFEYGKPCVTFVRVGDDPASISYVKKKEKTAASLGIDARLLVFPATISENQLLAEIDRLNGDISVHGILVQAPPFILMMFRYLTGYHPPKMWMDLTQ